MRLMKSIASKAFTVPAAHSRVVRPGDVVDFDELVASKLGKGCTLEAALSDDVAQFEPVADEPAAAEATAPAAIVEAPAPVADEPVAVEAAQDAPTPEEAPADVPQAGKRGKR